MKTDRRVQRTRKLLRDALIELILEKGYDAVTVQEITDRANLGRATFYLHYRDGGKEALLLSTLREVFDDLKSRVGPLTPENLLQSGDDPLRVLPFQHAHDNRDLYRVILLSKQGTAAILNEIRAYLADAICARLDALLTEAPPAVPLPVVANYLAGSMISMIAWWLEQDTPYTADDLAAMFQQLTAPLLQNLMQKNGF